MIVNDAFSRLMQERLGSDTQGQGNALPVDLLDVSDISRAIIFPCSADAQYITGVTLPVDAGMVNK